MVIKAMARNIGSLANVVILLLGVIYTVKILVHGTFIPRLSHYPQPAELIAHLRRFATHALAVSIASYVNMCEYCLHMLLVVSWFPLHQWSILKFLSFVAEKIFGPSLLPAPVADVSSSSKFMALFKVMIGAKIEPYHANIFVNLLPVSVSSQLMLRSCYHQSLAPVKGSLWKMLPAIPYMLAQSPMPADVIDQVISLFSGVEHSLEAEACPMVTSSCTLRITATFACVVVTPLMVVYLRRVIWNVCHRALCLVARAARMVLFWSLKMTATIVFKLLKFVLGCICTVSAYRSYSLADDLMSSPLVPILMMHNPIAVRRVCILSSQLMLHTCYHQSLAPVRGSLWKILPAIQCVLAQSPIPADVIDQVISLFSSVGRSLEAEAYPMVTSRLTATFACVVVTALMVVYLRRPIWNVCRVCIHATTNSINTVSGAQQGAPESINEDKDDFFNEEMTRRMSASSNAKPTISTAAATEADATPSATTATADATTKTAAEPTPSATTKTAAEPTPSATATTVADPTADSVNTFGGVQQAAPENINQDNDDVFNYVEMSRDMSASSNAAPLLSTPAATEADSTPPATTTAQQTHPSATTAIAADPTANSVNTFGGAQQVAPENINQDNDDVFNYVEMSRDMSASSNAAPLLSTPAATEADSTPPATTTAQQTHPSATTAIAADPTANSVNTFGGAQQVAPENINQDNDDVFNYVEMSRDMSASSNAAPLLSTPAATEADPTPPATTHTAADPTPRATTDNAADPTPSATTDTTTAADHTRSAAIATAADPNPSDTAATADHIPPTDITASGGEGLEASMWAPGNQAVEFDTQEEIDDLWSAFHSMKKQTKRELAATAKPRSSIDTAASGEGSEASMWAPGNQAVEFDTQEEIDDLWSAFHSMKKQTKGELAPTAKPRSSIDTAASAAWVQWGIRARDYCQFPTGWSCNQVGQFRHPPLANIGVEAYRADSRLDGAPAESIQTIPGCQDWLLTWILQSSLGADFGLSRQIV
ncbi:hypothetical protein BU17DRAFT_64750 [Hysterangium stoloniferum]|nr:hypothetical protein BU17DRAFT_64750 [Hysterangium stoloniferum]